MLIHNHTLTANKTLIKFNFDNNDDSNHVQFFFHLIVLLKLFILMLCLKIFYMLLMIKKIQKNII